MNIYKHEFKMKIKSVITWSLSLGILIFVFMSLYPSFAEDTELLNDVLANMPPEFLEAFGMAGIDMSTVLGFFGMVLLMTSDATASLVPSFIDPERCAGVMSVVRSMFEFNQSRLILVL